MSVILKVLVASKSTDPSDGSHIGIQREVEINLVTRVDKLRPGERDAEGPGTTTKEILVASKRQGRWSVCGAAADIKMCCLLMLHWLLLSQPAHSEAPQMFCKGGDCEQQQHLPQPAGEGFVPT